nr:MAG TPA: hypothetical protein [Caudoviricetes sp.]
MKYILLISHKINFLLISIFMFFDFFFLSVVI